MKNTIGPPSDLSRAYTNVITFIYITSADAIQRWHCCMDCGLKPCMRKENTAVRTDSSFKPGARSCRSYRYDPAERFFSVHKIMPFIYLSIPIYFYDTKYIVQMTRPNDFFSVQNHAVYLPLPYRSLIYRTDATRPNVFFLFTKSCRYLCLFHTVRYLIYSYDVCKVSIYACVYLWRAYCCTPTALRRKSHLDPNLL